jgi:hypothetical protein
MDDARVKQLGRDYARKLLDGVPFSDEEYAEYLAYLEYRETAGSPLLGPYAGKDRSSDTVYGRCGLRPPEFTG